MRASEIEKLLPEVIRMCVPTSPLLAGTLSAMEALHEPVEAALDSLDAVLDPRTASDPFVRHLAHWVDLDWLLAERATTQAVDPVQLRSLVARAAELSQWRGTAYGLCTFLELATGLTGYVIDEAAPSPEGGTRAFHIVVQCPPAAARHEPLLRRIVEFEKPAYVTYDLMFAAAPSSEGRA